jgi:hypothetical protein
MRKIITIVLISPLVTILISCNNTAATSPIQSNNPTNLLINPSFEENGEQSLVGWDIYMVEPVGFSNDVPDSDSGKWSAEMFGYPPDLLIPWPIFYLYSVVYPSVSKSIYNFDFWAKADSCEYGTATIFIYSKDSLIAGKSIDVENPEWTMYNIIDTLASNNVDSIKVGFFPGAYTGENGGKMLVDNCSLIAK